MGKTVNEPRGIRCCYAPANIYEGSNAGTIKITDAIVYTIGGLSYAKAATDNIAMTAAVAQAALTSCVYLVTINAAGTVATVKSNVVLTADLVAGDAIIEWPTPADGYAVIGAILVQTAAATTFTAGTTDLGASGITDKYVSLATLPGSLEVDTTKFSGVSPTPSASASASASASVSPSPSPS